MVTFVKIFKIKEKLHTDLDVYNILKKVHSWEIEKYNKLIITLFMAS